MKQMDWKIWVYVLPLKPPDAYIEISLVAHFALFGFLYSHKKCTVDNQTFDFRAQHIQLAHSVGSSVERAAGPIKKICLNHQEWRCHMVILK